MSLNGCITDSACQYISTGSFFDNASTSYVFIGTLWNVASYYLDDVKLSTDSAFVNGINEQNDNHQVEVYPNPFNNNLSFTTNNNFQSSIIIYDITSRKIFNQSFTNSISINTSHLSKGIYIYEVRNKNGPDNYREIKKGKVVKE